MSIMVDTGAWYAVADSSDRHHGHATQFYVGNAGRVPLVTTDLILVETWALLNARLGRSAALTFWSTLRETRVPILNAEAVDLEAAWRIAQSYPDQTFSFVDCATFAQMERLGIADAFSFDSHYLIYRYGPHRQRALRRLPA